MQLAHNKSVLVRKGYDDFRPLAEQIEDFLKSWVPLAGLAIVVVGIWLLR